MTKYVTKAHIHCHCYVIQQVLMAHYSLRGFSANHRTKEIVVQYRQNLKGRVLQFCHLHALNYTIRQLNVESIMKKRKQSR